MKPIVLVVDDNSDLLETMAFIIREKGLEVVTAGDGEEALAMYHKHAPAILLTDQQMPKMNGTELLERVSAGPCKPVTILMTGYPTTDVLRGLFQMEADHYLTKPIKWGVLEQTIDDILQSLEWNEPPAIVHEEEPTMQAMDEEALDDNTNNLNTISTPVSEEEKNGQPFITLAGENAHTKKMLGGCVVYITSFPFRIGREGKTMKDQNEQPSVASAPSNDLNLDDPRPHRISRAHFQIEFCDPQFFVRDMGSKLGLLVNGHPVGGLHSKKVQGLIKGANILVLGGESSPYRLTITV